MSRAQLPRSSNFARYCGPAVVVANLLAATRISSVALDLDTAV